MSDYTPTTEEVREAAGGSLNYITSDEFDRWLAAHDAEVRADEREESARRVFDEEQKVNPILWRDPTNPHLSGVLRGLQRARDLLAAARGETDG